MVNSLLAARATLLPPGVLFGEHFRRARLGLLDLHARQHKGLDRVVNVRFARLAVILGDLCAG